jgi:hypothetical protein
MAAELIKAAIAAAEAMRIIMKGSCCRFGIEPVLAENQHGFHSFPDCGANVPRIERMHEWFLTVKKLVANSVRSVSFRKRRHNRIPSIRATERRNTTATAAPAHAVRARRPKGKCSAGK